jgi:REP-associated tyrosine transposase
VGDLTNSPEQCPIKSDPLCLVDFNIGVHNRSRATPKQCPIKMARRAQLQLRLPTPVSWGGRRAGAGRKSPAFRPEKRHAARPAHRSRFPVLVTIRARPNLPSLRSLPTFDTFSRALARANRDNFRVIHFSVQTDHIHLIVEASSREALIRGLQGLAARTARALNGTWRRSGKVWNARYHSRALATPREVRNGLVYVLLNFRKHLRVDGHRSAELRAVVRRVVVAAAGDKCAMPRCAAADLARSRRLATRRRSHRSARRARGKPAGDIDHTMKVRGADRSGG